MTIKDVSEGLKQLQGRARVKKQKRFSLDTEMHERIERYAKSTNPTLRAAAERFLDKSDLAMLNQEEKKELGGIDLNPEHTVMRRQGDEVKIKFPAYNQETSSEPVDGFIPIIINIVPVTNIPLLLGETDFAEKPQLSLL